MGQFKDISGQRFGKLVALRAERDSSGRRYVWECQCDCGNRLWVPSVSLTTGKKQSCGCIIRGILQNRNTTHGHSHERLYKVWKGMKSRCYNQHHRSYEKYGGRGITVCDEWHDYSVFREWAYANGYDENADYQQCSLDRIDVNGNYSPENCRWADAFTQAANTQTALRITFDGETRTIPEWAKEYGLQKDTLHYRIKSGWDIGKALTTPARPLHSRK